MTTTFPARASSASPCDGGGLVGSTAHFERILRAHLLEIEARHHDLSVERVAEAHEQIQIAVRNEANARQASHDRMMARLIRAALDRIKDGSFGVCVSCSGEIGEKRLNAVPFTPHCICCASRIDRRPTDLSADARRDSGPRLREFDEVEVPGRGGE